MTINEILDKWKKCQVDGWCSEEKAKRFIQIILFTKPKLAVDIGTFTGSSFIPIALAMKEVDGIAYAIDAWDRKVALEEMKSPDGLLWWGNLDFNMICKEIKRKVDSLNLGEHAILIKDRSENISDSFSDESIGLLHLDGSHGNDGAMRDAALYATKVCKGGYVVVNDATWSEGGVKTIGRSIKYLADNGFKVIEECDWVLLQKD